MRPQLLANRQSRAALRILLRRAKFKCEIPRLFAHLSQDIADLIVDIGSGPDHKCPQIAVINNGARAAVDVPSSRGNDGLDQADQVWPIVGRSCAPAFPFAAAPPGIAPANAPGTGPR